MTGVYDQTLTPSEQLPMSHPAIGSLLAFSLVCVNEQGGLARKQNIAQLMEVQYSVFLKYTFNVFFENFLSVYAIFGSYPLLSARANSSLTINPPSQVHVFNSESGCQDVHRSRAIHQSNVLVLGNSYVLQACTSISSHYKYTARCMPLYYKDLSKASSLCSC